MSFKDHLPTSVESQRRKDKENKAIQQGLFVANPPALTSTISSIGIEAQPPSSIEQMLNPLLEDVNNLVDNVATTVTVELDKVVAGLQRIQLPDVGAITIEFVGLVKNKVEKFFLDLTKENVLNTPTVTFDPPINGITQTEIDNNDRTCFLIFARDTEDEIRYDRVGGTGGASGALPAGTAENQHLEWNNSSMLWESRTNLEFGATGPHADAGFLRFENNALILAGRDVGNVSNIELKIDATSAIDWTESANSVVKWQLRAQHAVNPDASFKIQQNPDDGTTDFLTIIEYPGNLHIQRAAFTEWLFNATGNLIGSNNDIRGVNALVFDDFGTIGKDIAHFATGLHYDIENVGHTHTFRVSGNPPATVLEIAATAITASQNIVAAGAEEGMSNIGELIFINNGISPAFANGFYSNGTDMFVRSNSVSYNLSNVGGANFTDATFRITDESILTKKMGFDVGAKVAAATTRIYTVPNADGEMFITPAQIDLNMNTWDIFGVDRVALSATAAASSSLEKGLYSLDATGGVGINILNNATFAVGEEEVIHFQVDGGNNEVSITNYDFEINETVGSTIFSILKTNGNSTIFESTKITMNINSALQWEQTDGSLTFVGAKGQLANIDQLGFRNLGNLIQDDTFGINYVVIAAAAPNGQHRFNDSNGTVDFLNLHVDHADFGGQTAGYYIEMFDRANPGATGFTDKGRIYFDVNNSSRLTVVRNTTAIPIENQVPDADLTDLGDVSVASVKANIIVHNGTSWISLPVGVTNDHVLTVDAAQATGMKWAAGGGGGANTALSNLASVAINTSLVSDTHETDDLGSTSILWNKLWVADAELRTTNGFSLLEFTRADTTENDGDVLGRIMFQGQDSVPSSQQYAWIQGIAVDVSSGTEDGGVEVRLVHAGDLTDTVLAITSSASSLNLHSETDGRLEIQHINNALTPGPGTDLMILHAVGKASDGTDYTYGIILFEVDDDTVGAEDGRLTLGLATGGGTVLEMLEFRGAGTGGWSEENARFEVPVSVEDNWISFSEKPGSFPSATTNKAKIYAQDNGGKTELVVQFQTGGVVQIAIEA